MPSEHARLSASASHRWMNCPPSALLCEAVPDETSDYAKEGTCAHSLCEFKLRRALGQQAADPTEDLDFFSSEMDECSDEYVAFIIEALEEERKAGRNPLVLIEQRLDFSSYVPEGFGTGDALIITDGRLHIIDFKYGKGVLVEAQENSQMMLYALGACEMLGSLYEIDEITMTIFQPRLGNISSWSMTNSELYSWANLTLAPAAKMAIKGEGELKAGPWCRFCKVKASCRKRAEESMALASYEFREPPILTDEEIAIILAKIDELVSWADDVRQFALSEALKGKRIDGFKLVEGRSIRRYSDEAKAAEAVSLAGFDPYERSVKGITAMTALLGKARFNEMLGALVVKPQGKPTLVPEADKRPEMTINDFNDTEE
ncbi:MAG: DUF2800 domain-containing protein [Sphaerochaetaceae bacterium]